MGCTTAFLALSEAPWLGAQIFVSSPIECWGTAGFCGNLDTSMDMFFGQSVVEHTQVRIKENK